MDVSVIDLRSWFCVACIGFRKCARGPRVTLLVSKSKHHTMQVESSTMGFYYVQSGLGHEHKLMESEGECCASNPVRTHRSSRNPSVQRFLTIYKVEIILLVALDAADNRQIEWAL